MKKSLLFTLLFSLSLTVLAQQSPCVPDASLQDSTFGLWPDTIQNLPIAQLDTYYEEHIQIKTPNTVGEVMGDPYEIDVLGFPVNIAPLEIDSIKLVGVNGLPSVMSTYLSNSDSVFMGNDIACVTLFGTPGVDELGTHDISLIIDGWINVSVIGTVSLYDQLGDYETIDGYRLVVQSEMVSIDENNNLSFSVSQNSPNPFSNRTSIEFNSTTEGEYLFSVVNLLGEVQDHRIINANYGSNKIDVDASALSSGIYFYTLSNAQGMITKKMIINKN
ncbi:MAG: T9SS type A sorting domain-containing protein [Flavobacteriales bacterium]